jgi:hypothetical protein
MILSICNNVFYSLGSVDEYMANNVFYSLGSVDEYMAEMQKSNGKMQ